MADYELVARLRGDTAQFHSEMGRAKRELADVDSAGKKHTGSFKDAVTGHFGKAGDASDGLVGKLTGMSPAMLGVASTAGVMGLAVAKFAITAGSDLAESLSKSNAIFGEQAAAIEKWASGAARGFGQSKQQALEAAASFGNMFSQMGIGAGEATNMSKSMVELSADFASFHNADITEVIQAQTAAFRGEYDAVQRFVPTINAAAVEEKALAMGLAGTKDELTAGHKAMATYALLTEGAGKAAGDFDKTSGGLANQQRILKAQVTDVSAELGQAMIPMLTQLGSIIIPVITGVSDLADKVGGLGTVGGFVAKAMLPALGVLDLIPGKNKKAGDSAKDHAGAQEGLGEATEGAAKAADVGAKSQAEMAKEIKKAEGEAAKYQEKITGMAASISMAYISMGGKTHTLTEYQRRLAAGFDEAKSAADQLKSGLDILTGVNISATRAAIDWESKLASTTAKLRENRATLDISTEAGRENTGAILDMVMAGQSHIEAMVRTGASVRETTHAHNDHVAALRRVMEQAGYSKEEIEALLQRYNLLAGAPDIRKDIEVHTTYYSHNTVAQEEGVGYAGVQKYHDGGIVGGHGDVPILAKGGEGVFTKGQMEALGLGIRSGWGGDGAMAGGGGNYYVVNVYSATGDIPDETIRKIRAQLFELGNDMPAGQVIPA